MTSEWPLVPVAEACELVVDCVNKTAPIAEFVTPYRMIRTTNVKGGRLDMSQVNCVSKETFDIWTRRALPSPGDVILTREAPLGEIAIVRDEGKIFLGQRLVQYRAQRGVLDPRFLLYAFLSPALQAQIHAHDGSGSTVDHIRVPDCLAFKIPLPPIQLQRAIAHILGTLDDKIELLRRTNQTLEETARVLFKSWFVDFDPVQAKAAGRKAAGIDADTAKLFPREFEVSALGPIPKGWTLGPMSDFVAVHGGSTPRTAVPGFWDDGTANWATPKDLSGLASSVLLSTERKITPAGLAEISSGLLPTGTLLLSSRAPIGYLAIAHIPVAVNQGIAAMPPGGRLSPLYMLNWTYHHMDQIRARAGGSTFPEISKGNLRSLPMVAPIAAISARYDEIAGSLFARVVANAEAIVSLAETRDTLLPKLLSGSLRIPDVERFLSKENSI